MTRQEYIAQLTAQLFELPEEEREAAVEYYDGYIADAGEENEAQVLQELGTPQQLADAIKRETKSAEEEGAAADYSRTTGLHNTRAAYGMPFAPSGTAKRKLSGGMLLLVILTFPLWISVLATVGALLFSMVILVAAVAVALVAGAVGLLAGGIAGVVVSIGTLITVPLEGLLGMGAALVCVGLGLCFMAGGIAMCGKGIPACWRGLCTTFRAIFRRGGAEG